MEGKMMSSKTMEKQWKKMKKCGFDVRPLAMEKQWKNRGTDEEVEKNNGKHIGKIAALMWDQNDAK